MKNIYYRNKNYVHNLVTITSENFLFISLILLSFFCLAFTGRGRWWWWWRGRRFWFWWCFRWGFRRSLWWSFWTSFRWSFRTSFRAGSWTIGFYTIFIIIIIFFLFSFCIRFLFFFTFFFLFIFTFTGGSWCYKIIGILGKLLLLNSFIQQEAKILAKILNV